MRGQMKQIRGKMMLIQGKTLMTQLRSQVKVRVESQTNGDRNQGLNDESRDLGENSDESSDIEEYHPQKKWKFKKFLRGRFRNGRREIYVEWEDGSKSWEPKSCFDDDVLEMIDRKFTKLGTIRKTCFKRKH